MTNLKFYRCSHCGNIITYVNNSGVAVECCGEPMQELIPNSSGAAVEKHMPVVEIKNNVVTVTVGEVIHPMAEEHHIVWIALETKKGFQFKELKVGGEPRAIFVMTDDDEAVAAYEYCNLHGLWRKDI